jgi:hypothetical protein
MNVENDFLARRFGIALVLLVAVSGGAQAQTLDFGSCVRIEDLSARLACYDRAAGRGAPASPSAPRDVAPPPPARAAAAPPAPLPAPAPPPVVAPADPVATFGATSRVDPLTAPKARKEAEPELPKQIEAKVTAVRARATGEQILTLDNGQVWEQTESRREPRYEVGDTIIIRRGMLGSFMVTLAKGSPTTRIRRIS